MSNKVEFSDSEIKDILMTHLTGPHKELLGEAILGMLGDELWKKGLLLKVCLGSQPQSELTLRETYYVDQTHTRYWQHDEDKMIAAGLINENNKIKCVLVKYNPWSATPYEISYKFRDEKDAERIGTTGVVKHQLELVEEFPENYLLDDI